MMPWEAAPASAEAALQRPTAPAMQPSRGTKLALCAEASSASCAISRKAPPYRGQRQRWVRCCSKGLCADVGS